MRLSRLGIALALTAGLAGCGYISFSRGLTNDEVLLQQEVRSLYNDLNRAFVVGNPDALTGLFDPSIVHPMTYSQIQDWARKFFSENKSAHFRVDNLVFNELGYLQAKVTVTYKVETPDGKGDFGGTEYDSLVKRRGRWYISGWEKLK